MVAIAVANGAVREAGLKKRLGEARARQVSTLLLVAFFAIYMAAIFRIWPLASAAQAVQVGALWLALTLAFELALGRWVSKLSWPEIVAEYNLLAGRLWLLVPLWVALAPYLFFRWQAPR
ncbi:MAG TPA: hypothetical protein VF211_05575 [Burkholderiales bacterium]